VDAAMRANVRARANLDFRADNAEGTDFDAFAQLRAGIDDGARVDIHCAHT